MAALRELRPYFEPPTSPPLAHPPNVVDTDLDAFGADVASEYRLPPIVAATNLLCRYTIRPKRSWSLNTGLVAVASSEPLLRP